MIRQLPRHLTRLSRDPATGWPAPYVNAWTSEEVEPFCWQLGEWRGMRAAHMITSVGRGSVDFTRQHMTRQRRVIDERRCQVCRDPNPTLLPIGAVSGSRDVIDGVAYGVFAEPLLCELCASFALDHCPGLIRQKRHHALAMVNVERYEVTYSIGTHDVVSPNEAVVLWAKIAIPLSALPAWLAEALPEWVPT